jgi:hypothetical protein
MKDIHKHKCTQKANGHANTKSKESIIIDFKFKGSTTSLPRRKKTNAYCKINYTN